MKFYASYKGFDIFTEKDSTSFVVFMDTPDGMIRCNRPFQEYSQVTEFIDKA